MLGVVSVSVALDISTCNITECKCKTVSDLFLSACTFQVLRSPSCVRPVLTHRREHLIQLQESEKSKIDIQCCTYIYIWGKLLAIEQRNVQLSIIVQKPTDGCKSDNSDSKLE